MILSFLQTRNPPVLPCLHKRPHQRLLGADGKPSAFADDLASLHGFGHKNKESLGELLFHFFRRYAHELDYERNVISVREGTLISKEDKKWHLMQNNRLCVEEPFNTERNLGNTADDISFRGVHLELRRAFDLISEAKLDECMEQFIFPAVEEKIWEKPPPKPPPVLTRSQSQSGRGGRGGITSRGGRHTLNQHRNGQQGRRASSATASNKFPNAPTMPRTIALWEQPLQSSYDQFQLHERLMSDYQLLQAQEHELRRVQAQAQLQAQLHIHGPSSMTASNQPPPLTAPLREKHPAFHSPYPSANIPSHQALHSHPPSPSLQTAQPELRRSVHRSIATPPSSTLRSSSQPARALPLPLPIPSYFSGYPSQHYQRQQQIYSYLESQGRHRHPELSAQNPAQIDSRFEENVPKEYIGYYVHEPPSSLALQNDAGIGRVPIPNEMTHRVIGMQHSLSRFEDPSRSPSPSTPYRDRSTSVRSAASAPPGPLQVPVPSPRTSGPIIVDGSDVWAPSENGPRTEPRSDRVLMNGTNQVSRLNVHRSPLADEQYHRSGRSETIASMPSRQQLPFHVPNGAHAFVDNARTPNIEQKPRRPYPQVNGTAPAPVTAQLQSSGVTNYDSSKSNTLSRQQDSSAASPAQSPSAQTKDLASEPSPLKGLPLLSPVREVRTPSPTAHRKEDNATEIRPFNRLAQKYRPQAIPPFSRKVEGREKPSQQSPTEPNGSAVGSLNSVQTAQLTNGWQQTSSKKGKKNKWKGSGLQPSEPPLGEPMPANIAERKGG